jgi:hypothetical protein
MHGIPHGDQNSLLNFAYLFNRLPGNEKNVSVSWTAWGRLKCTLLILLGLWGGGVVGHFSLRIFSQDKHADQRLLLCCEMLCPVNKSATATERIASLETELIMKIQHLEV